jgi:hypothetical protein
MGHGEAVPCGISQHTVCSRVCGAGIIREPRKGEVRCSKPVSVVWCATADREGFKCICGELLSVRRWNWTARFGDSATVSCFHKW